MAACDNLYGCYEEWIELFQFLRDKKPEYLIYMHIPPPHPDDMSEGGTRICYIASIQGFLIKNCHFDWVKERLQDNFDIQRIICGKAHHE